MICLNIDLSQALKTFNEEEVYDCIGCIAYQSRLCLQWGLRFVCELLLNSWWCFHPLWFIICLDRSLVEMYNPIQNVHDYLLSCISLIPSWIKTNTEMVREMLVTFWPCVMSPNSMAIDFFQVLLVDDLDTNFSYLVVRVWEGVILIIIFWCHYFVFFLSIFILFFPCSNTGNNIFVMN